MLQLPLCLAQPMCENVLLYRTGAARLPLLTKQQVDSMRTMHYGIVLVRLTMVLPASGVLGT
jgi:hypothetical protein